MKKIIALLCLGLISIFSAGFYYINNQKIDNSHTVIKQVNHTNIDRKISSDNQNRNHQQQPQNIQHNQNNNTNSYNTNNYNNGNYSNEQYRDENLQDNIDAQYENVHPYDQTYGQDVYKHETYQNSNYQQQDQQYVDQNQYEYSQQQDYAEQTQQLQGGDNLPQNDYDRNVAQDNYPLDNDGAYYQAPTEPDPYYNPSVDDSQQYNNY